MKALATLKRFICYSLVVLPIACFQQEIKTQPDSNTRACLLKNILKYRVIDNQWGTSSENIDYNQDGNPVTWKVFFDGLSIARMLTFEYDGLRLKRMNFYREYGTDTTLSHFKLYYISPKFDTLIERSFRAKNPTEPYLIRQFIFIRNINNDLRLQRVDSMTVDKNDNRKINYTGTYKRFTYDKEGRNLNKIFNKNGTIKNDTLMFSYDGFDPNSRSPWNANFWLSFTQGYIDRDKLEGHDKDDYHFDSSVGYWSENNLSIEKKGETRPLYYNVYELNDQGFACVSSVKQADNKPNQEETFYYYYNCECRKR